jgi:hypothetical protein
LKQELKDVTEEKNEIDRKADL